MRGDFVTIAELDARLEGVRARMRARELGGLIVADPANIYYLSGYDAWSFYTPQILFVPLDGEPVLAMREMDALGAHRTALKYADEVLGYPEPLVHHPDVHPMEWIARKLRDAGYGRKMKVGFEGDAHFFAVRSYLAFVREIPEWELVESRELVNWVRLVKSQAEITMMRCAGAIASEAMRSAVAAIEEGVTLNVIAAQVLEAQARGVGPLEGDYPAIVPMFPHGESANTPHLTWSATPVAKGEIISVELAGVYRRYHSPLARSVILGTPSRELDRVAGATVEGLNAAMEEMKPGNTPDDVTAAWNGVMKRNGLRKDSRLGYSIGVGYPPDWGERTVSIREGDHTVFQENMTFHMIAGMWLARDSFEVSESVRIGPSGAEVLTNCPRALIVKEDYERPDHYSLRA